ncbi:peptidase M16 domain protein [Gemmatirosa kalamazoonensis]|uniref:Peptidase M16 domain protein n=1 Tax=Gemmatirosa kalamazoonensis TaxID=861299 RepID=W0RDG2_9BACT|nr:pitrilysin family protein [Gemmatirosa kalamazoonensis]AHG88350.1 peptidase M16 domain protein [Gemmatirosa kalamazoonensis]
MRLTSLLRPTALALAVAVAPPLSAQATAISIPNERMTLPNGLQVLLAPDHSTPRVTVDVWYHVGSKNEVPGRTGFAHMFEHVMFTGSGHVPYGLHDRLTEGVGGDNNGSTTEDRTNYYENVPSNYLESALWMEADRMGFLLDKLDEAKFSAQRDIVQNERRQRTDNQPYGRAFEIVTAAMVPAANPYSWPVVGYMSDLKQATVEDVKNFFRLYYAPSNATLAIVGDFDPAQAKAWVRKYFSDLPRGAAITRPSVPAVTMPNEKRLVYEDRVQVPRLYVAWPSVGETGPDRHALDLLGEVLTSSRTARLTKALVYDRQSAASVNAGQNTNENAGAFFVLATPRPGHTLAELEATTDSVLERLKREGPTAEEIAKAKAGLEFGFVNGLQSNLGKAEILNSGAVFHGDPGYFQQEYAALKAVTAADVQRVANKYLGAGRVVLSVVPQGKRELAAKAEASTPVAVSPDGGHYIMESK